jgi:hypothetical protein
MRRRVVCSMSRSASCSSAAPTSTSSMPSAAIEPHLVGVEQLLEHEAAVDARIWTTYSFARHAHFASAVRPLWPSPRAAGCTASPPCDRGREVRLVVVDRSTARGGMNETMSIVCRDACGELLQLGVGEGDEAALSRTRSP